MPPPTTAPPVNKTEEVRKIVRRLGHDAETSEVRKALGLINIAVDDTIIRTVKREIPDEVQAKPTRNGQHPKPQAKVETPKKPTPKKERQVGAGKEALFEMFRTQGTQIDYATAYRQLNGKGLQVGAEWFRRLKQEYIAQNPEAPNVATAEGLAAVMADSAAPAKELRSGSHVPDTGAVTGRAEQIPLRDDQIPAPATKPSPVEMVRAGRKFIQMMGSKEEALALLSEL